MNPQAISLRALVRLRWFAIAGQLLAIVLAQFWLGLGFSLPHLLSGVLALALFNAWASLRSRRTTTPLELFLHLLMDIAVLSWLLVWSGGAANPFVSLYLVPLALVISSLSPLATWLSVLICLLAYALVAIFGVPLPHLHGRDAFNLHLWGMAVSFALSAALFVVFLGRSHRELRAREAQLSRLNERLVRSEGVIAVASHAAALAHSLNTPLATMLLTVEELQLNRSLDATAQKDTKLLAELIAECNDSIRALLKRSQAAPALAPLGVFLDALVERFALLRPAHPITLKRSSACAQQAILQDDAITHMLLALLDNAADAGAASDCHAITLTVTLEDTMVRFDILDHGVAQLPISGDIFRSDKPTGWGLGLALSELTVARFGGTLALSARPEGGSLARVLLPILARPT